MEQAFAILFRLLAQACGLTMAGILRAGVWVHGMWLRRQGSLSSRDGSSVTQSLGMPAPKIGTGIAKEDSHP